MESLNQVRLCLRRPVAAGIVYVNALLCEAKTPTMSRVFHRRSARTFIFSELNFISRLDVLAAAQNVTRCSCYQCKITVIKSIRRIVRSDSFKQVLALTENIKYCVPRRLSVPTFPFLSSASLRQTRRRILSLDRLRRLDITLHTFGIDLVAFVSNFAPSVFTSITR